MNAKDQDQETKMEKRAILQMLTQMLSYFSASGWGQNGSITEFTETGEFRHKVNVLDVSPLDFIRSFQPHRGADALMFHWEYFPPAQVIYEDPGVEIFRALLWADRAGHSTAIFCGADPSDWVMAPSAFTRELQALEEILDSNDRRSEESSA